MPTISGWSASPTTTGVRPRASASRTTAWIWVTLGQVASMTRQPRAASAAYARSGSPWARMSTAAPSGASSGVRMVTAPMSSRRRITWSLWVRWPSRYTGPSPAARSASSTARRTP